MNARSLSTVVVQPYVDYLTLRQLNKMHCLKSAVKIVHDLAKRESNHTPNPQDILAAFQLCSTSDIVVCQKKFLTSISHLSSPMIGFSVKHNYGQMSQTKKSERNFKVTHCDCSVPSQLFPGHFQLSLRFVTMIVHDEHID